MMKGSLLYTMRPLSGLQGPRGSGSPLCGNKWPFHAARPSVVQLCTADLLWASGTLSRI